MCRLYAHTMLFSIQGFEHTWILVSAGGPGTNSLQIQSDDRIPLI